MATIDPQFVQSFVRMQRAYDALLSLREQVTPAELALAEQWQADLDPLLRSLYWYPLRNGIDEAPDDAVVLRTWLLDRYAHAAATDPLARLLARYQVHGVNLGGRMALQLLAIDAPFGLTERDYLDQLAAHTATLTQAGTDLSLIDTTVDDLVRGIPAARASNANTALTLGSLIAGWSLYRSDLIAVTETTRQVGNGLNWTFWQNGVQWQEFVTREDRRVCPLCAPLHGQRMRTNRIPVGLRLPIHGHCRCTYRPVLTGWERPRVIWAGG